MKKYIIISLIALLGISTGAYLAWYKTNNKKDTISTNYPKFPNQETILKNISTTDESIKTNEITQTTPTTTPSPTITKKTKPSSTVKPTKKPTTKVTQAPTQKPTKPTDFESPPDVTVIDFILSTEGKSLQVDYIETYKAKTEYHGYNDNGSIVSTGSLYIYTDDWTSSKLPTGYILYYWEKYQDEANPPADGIWSKDYQPVDKHYYTDENGQEKADTIYRITVENPDKNREEYLYGYLADDSMCTDSLAEDTGSTKPGSEYKCFDVNLYKEFWVGENNNYDLVPVYIKISLNKDASEQKKQEILNDLESSIISTVLN